MENGCVRGGDPHRSLRKDLVAGHAEGAAAGGMTGLGETYLPAFALAVGLGEITAGLVASLPLLVGGLMQTFSPLAIRRLGSHKRWVLLWRWSRRFLSLRWPWRRSPGGFPPPEY